MKLPPQLSSRIWGTICFAGGTFFKECWVRTQSGFSAGAASTFYFFDASWENVVFQLEANVTIRILATAALEFIDGSTAVSLPLWRPTNIRSQSWQQMGLELQLLRLRVWTTGCSTSATVARNDIHLMRYTCSNLRQRLRVFSFAIFDFIHVPGSSISNQFSILFSI